MKLIICDTQRKQKKMHKERKVPTALKVRAR